MSVPAIEKMRAIFFKLFPIVALLATACTKVIEIDLPQHEPKAVVNCFFTTDSLFSLTLDRSYSIFDTMVPPIGNAEVTLWEEGIPIDTFYFSGEYYQSHEYPKQGKNYHIEVNSPHLGSVLADSYIPPSPILKSVSIRDSVYRDTEGYFVSQAKITIDDPGFSDNYYELRMLSKSKVSWSDSAITSVYYDLKNDPILENEGLLPYYPDSVVFGDALFDGKEQTIRVNYRRGISNREYYELVVILRAVTKEYYQYKKSLILHLAGQESDIWDGSGSPLQMSSNIKGGYGIFTGYSEVIRILHK